MEFSKTFHKVQGKMCTRITVDLNDRPFCPHVTYNGLLVSLSRVKNHLHWCRMPNQPGTTGIAYLKKLKPHHDLISWLHSYDVYGLWQQHLCLETVVPVVKTKITRKKTALSVKCAKRQCNPKNDPRWLPSTMGAQSIGDNKI